ncbi:WD40 repeat domain-containing protein, partial [Actinomadura parmotrematis]
EGHASGVNAVGWSPDGGVLASGDGGGGVRLWDPVSGECLRTLEGHASGVRAVGWSPDGGVLATGGGDGGVRLWDPVSGECLRTLEGHTDFVRDVSWSPDGRTLTTSSDDRSIRFWEASSGRLIATIVPLRDGAAVVGPDELSYKMTGNPAGELWWTIGLCRYEPGELDEFVPEMQRFPDDAPLSALSTLNRSPE